jgi:hypothetical protein
MLRNVRTEILDARRFKNGLCAFELTALVGLPDNNVQAVVLILGHWICMWFYLRPFREAQNINIEGEGPGPVQKQHFVVAGHLPASLPPESRAQVIFDVREHIGMNELSGPACMTDGSRRVAASLDLDQDV